MESLNIAAASGKGIFDVRVDTNLVRTPEPVRVVGFHASPGENAAADADSVHRIAAATDETGQAMLLSLSGKNELFLISRDAEAKGGYRQQSLSASFKKTIGAAPWVQSFAIYQGTDKSLTLVVAAAKSETAPSHLFLVTGITPKRLSRGAEWTYLGTRSDFVVTRFQVTSSSDSTTLWCGVGAKDGPDGSKRWSDLYAIDAEAAGLSDTPAKVWPGADLYPLTVDGDLLDFDGGFDSDYGAGVYCLIRRVDKSAGIQFLSLPFKLRRSDKVGKSQNRSWLAIKGQYTSLTTFTQDDGGATDVYLAGDNIARLDADVLAANHKSKKLLTPAPILTDGPYTEIFCAVDESGAVNCFGLADDGLLQTCRSEGATWTPAASLRKNVMQIAPAADLERGGASVYVGYLDGRLAKIVRRPNIGVWAEEDVAVQDTGVITERQAYQTRVVVRDGSGAPLTGGAVKLRASSWCIAKVNGGERILDPHVDRETKAVLDSRGGLTLSIPASNLSPPLIRIEMDALAEGVDVDPTAPLKAASDGLTTKMLLDAKKGANRFMRGSKISDQQVVGAEFRDAASKDTLDGVTSGLSTLSSLSGQGALRGVKKGGAVDSKLKPPKTTGTWGVSVAKDNGKTTSLSDDKAQKIAAQKAADSPLELLEGLWNDIETFTEDALEVVVDVADDVVRFIVKTANEVSAFVLETLEDIGSAFEWLWSKIKLGLAALVDWLGFIFDWPDIARMRDYIEASSVAAIDSGRGGVIKFRDSAAELFDKARTALASFADLPAETTSKKLDAGAAGGLLGNAGPDDPVTQALKALTENPALEWVLEKLQDFISNYIVKANLSAITSELEATFTTFINDIKAGVLDAVGDIQAFVDKLVSLVSAGNVSVESLAKLFAGEAGILVVDTARTVLIASLDMLEGLLGVFEAIVTQKLEFPLLSKIFGEKVASSPLKILATFIAAPVTVIYKILTGEAPIAEGEKLPVLSPAYPASGEFDFAAQSEPSAATKKASRVLGWMGVGALTVGMLWDDIERALEAGGNSITGPAAEVAIVGRATVKLVEIVGETPLTDTEPLWARFSYYAVDWLELGFPFAKQKGTSLVPTDEADKVNKVGLVIGIGLKALLAFPIVIVELKNAVEDRPSEMSDEEFALQITNTVAKFIQQETKEVGGMVATIGSLAKRPKVILAGALVEGASLAITAGRLAFSETQSESFEWL